MGLYYEQKTYYAHEHFYFFSNLGWLYHHLGA